MPGVTLCHLMDHLRPKTGNPLEFFKNLYFINIMTSVVIMDRRFCLNTITLMIPNNVDAYAKDSFMGIDNNDQEPGGIKNADVTYDQEPKEIVTNTNITYSDTDSDMGLNLYDIFKIKVITGTQYYPSALTSRTGGTQDDPSALTSRTGDSKKSSNATPDKVHRKNLVTSYPLQKYPIHKREITEPHGSKTHYKGSDNSYTERSRYEEKLKITNLWTNYLKKTKKTRKIQKIGRHFQNFNEKIFPE